jgi:hypothetical protein
VVWLGNVLSQCLRSRSRNAKSFVGQHSSAGRWPVLLRHGFHAPPQAARRWAFGRESGLAPPASSLRPVTSSHAASARLTHSTGT